MIARHWYANTGGLGSAGVVAWCAGDAAWAQAARQALQAEGWRIRPLAAPPQPDGDGPRERVRVVD
ncbi:MAG: hypothetical protein ACK4GB_07195 [Tepidimonas sp.]